VDCFQVIGQPPTLAINLLQKSVEDIDRDFAAVVLFSALGLLASFYFMTHFPPEGFLIPSP
jgi:hypothetical protein